MIYHELDVQIDGSHCVRFFAVDRKCAVGCAELELAGPVAQVFDLFVHADSRRLGVATNLLTRCERTARENGCLVLALACRPRNPANKFYRSLGWNETKVPGKNSVYSKILI